MDAKMLAHTHTVAAAAAIDHQDLCALKGSQDTNYAITSDDFRGEETNENISRKGHIIII